MATGELEYLDEEGLLALWAKIKATFVLKAGDTMTGALTTTTLTISSTTGEKHIAFSRSGGMSYITAPSTGSIGIMVADTISANNTFEFTSNVFRPYKNKEKSIGDSTHYWNDIYGTTIYENGTSLAAKYAGITLESYFDSNAKLKSDNMPTATSSALGGVMVGSTLAISSGVLNQESGICTPGTYRSVTVDTYGRVTAGTNPTTLSGYGITDAKIDSTDVITLGSNTIRGVNDSTQSFSGTKTFSDGIVLANNKAISGVNNPSSGSASTLSMLVLNTSNNLHLGLNTSSTGYSTYINGNNVYLRYGTSRTTGLTLSSGGQLTAAVPFTANSTLSVTGATTLGSTLSVSGDTTVSGNIVPSATSTATDNGYTLGTTDYRFRYLYSRYINISAASTLSGQATFGNNIRMANNMEFQMRTTETNTPYRPVLKMTTGNEFQVGYSGLNMRVMAARTDFDNPIILANNKSIGWMKYDGTTTLANMISLNTGNVLAIGYAHTSTGETRLHGQSITQYVGTTKIAEVNAIGITSYGGVAAMGIADLSIN